MTTEIRPAITETIEVLPEPTRTRRTVSEMTVIDDGASRRDLQERFEVKFALPGADVGKLRRLLEGGCRRIIHNQSVSVVRSIYLDDWRLSACYENLDGIGNRQKIRLRWYDRQQAPEDFFFEVKWRKAYLTGKHRLRIRADQPLSQMSYSQIIKALLIAIPEEYRPLLLFRAEPVVLVEYKREHFVSFDGALRVTLDYDLVFYDQMGSRRPSVRFGLPMPDMVVLEGKGAAGDMPTLRQMLYPFAPNATRSSKYVNGCRLLGLLANTVVGDD